MESKKIMHLFFPSNNYSPWSTTPAIRDSGSRLLFPIQISSKIPILSGWLQSVVLVSSFGVCPMTFISTTSSSQTTFPWQTHSLEKPLISNRLPMPLRMEIFCGEFSTTVTKTCVVRVVCCDRIKCFGYVLS